jgi:hypothetical protein
LGLAVGSMGSVRTCISTAPYWIGFPEAERILE